MTGLPLSLILRAQEMDDERLIAEHATWMRCWPRTLEQALALDVYSRELGLRHAPEPRLELVRRRRRQARDRLFPPLTIVHDDDEGA